MKQRRSAVWTFTLSWMPDSFANRTRCLCSTKSKISALGGFQIFFALSQTFEKFVAFAAAADKDVFVLKHSLYNAQNRFRAQVVSAVKAVHGFEDLVFTQAGIFQSTLLEAIFLDEIGFVFLDEPTVLAGHLEQLGAGVR